MKIGIFGGTFNPPHLGHMAAATAAIDTLNLDKLILIPDHTPPHKALPEHPVSSAHRMEMTRIMADRLDRPGIVEASDLEMHRSGKSYTSDTLKRLRELYPGDELWLMVGTDMFLTLQSWHEPEEIMSRAGILTFGRNRDDKREMFERQAQFLAKTYQAAVHIMTLPGLVEVCSTDLREQLARGGGSDYLDPAIYGYILRNQLYGTRADLKRLSLDKLRAASYSMIKSKRVPHVRGTEQEAAELARRWGANEREARQAAILHDCTKYWSLPKQLSKCAEYGIVLDQVEQKTLPLLHAKSAAAVARQVFGMPWQGCDLLAYDGKGPHDPVGESFVHRRLRRAQSEVVGGGPWPGDAGSGRRRAAGAGKYHPPHRSTGQGSPLSNPGGPGLAAQPGSHPAGGETSKGVTLYGRSFRTDRRHCKGAG